jgi:hypothetical protein
MFLETYKRARSGKLFRNSVVGVAIRYGLDGPEIESLWGQDFRTPPDRPWGSPRLLYIGYRVFPEAKAAGTSR